MATKATIVAAINAKVSDYKYWRIGLTHDPVERKKTWSETNSISAWSQWIADSLKDAQEIEAHFIDLGMKGGTGGDLSAKKTVYVYIF